MAALQHFAFYLKGARFLTLRTDVLAFLYIKQTVETSMVSFRLSSELSKYDFDIIHVPTRLHFRADYLTRFHEGERSSPSIISPDEASELIHEIYVKEGARFTKRQALEILSDPKQWPTLIAKTDRLSRKSVPSLAPTKAPKKTIVSPNFLYDSEAVRNATFRRTKPFLVWPIWAI